MKPTEIDPVFEEVVKFVQEKGLASASLIQRHFKLGYARSAHLLDELERLKIISEADCANPRKILIKDSSWKDNLKKLVNISQESASKVKWKKADSEKYSDLIIKNYLTNDNNLELYLGKDKDQKSVTINLEEYSSLLVVGSQYTNATKAIDSSLLLATDKYSPERLKIILIANNSDSFSIKTGNPHLLTPIISDSIKAMSALKWVVGEINRRSNQSTEERNNNPKIIVAINDFNYFHKDLLTDIEEIIQRIIFMGKKLGIIVILVSEMVDKKTLVNNLYNIPIKLVFKQINSESAKILDVPESFNLANQDNAILSVIYLENTLVNTIK